MGLDTAPNRAIAMAPTGFGTWGRDRIHQLGVAYRDLIDEIMPPLTVLEEGTLQLTPVR